MSHRKSFIAEVHIHIKWYLPKQPLTQQNMYQEKNDDQYEYYGMTMRKKMAVIQNIAFWR